jgi:hypothetical protein
MNVTTLIERTECPIANCTVFPPSTTSMQPLLYSTTTNTLHLRNFLQTPSLRQRLDTANLLDANHAERRLPVRRTTRREDLPRPRPACAVLSKKLDNKSTSSDGFLRALQQCARQEGERLVTRDAPPLLACVSPIMLHVRQIAHFWSATVLSWLFVSQLIYFQSTGSCESNVTVHLRSRVVSLPFLCN